MKYIFLLIGTIIFLVSCNNKKKEENQYFEIVKDVNIEIDTLNKINNLIKKNGFRNIKLNSLYSSYNFGDDWDIQHPRSDVNIKIVKYVDSLKFNQFEYPELSLYFFNDSLFCIDLDFGVNFSKFEYLKSIYGNPTIDSSDCYARRIDLGRGFTWSYFFNYYFYSSSKELKLQDEKKYLSLNKEFKKLNLIKAQQLKKKDGGQLLSAIIKSIETKNFPKHNMLAWISNDVVLQLIRKPVSNVDYKDITDVSEAELIRICNYKYENIISILTENGNKLNTNDSVNANKEKLENTKSNYNNL